MKNILIILPYGNLNPIESRDKQLNSIIKHMKNLIKKEKNNKYFLFISEQISPTKYFNRGQLLNIGLKYFKDNIGTPQNLIFHDIDILPNNKMFREYQSNKNSYSLVPSNSSTHKKVYGFKLTTGSAVYLTRPKLFIKVNGYPNNYWGWGGEDNALDRRYRLHNIKLHFNKKGNYESIDKQRKSNKDKLTYLKKNKVRNMMTWELLDNDKETWKTNGYNQLPYLNYDITYENINDIFSNLTKIHIKVKLDEYYLEKTIKLNEERTE